MIRNGPAFVQPHYGIFRDQFPLLIPLICPCASHIPPAYIVVTRALLTFPYRFSGYLYRLHSSAQSPSRLSIQHLTTKLTALFSSTGEIRLSDHRRLPYGHRQRYRIGPASHHRGDRLRLRHHHLVPHMRSRRGKTSRRQESCLVPLFSLLPTSATSRREWAGARTCTLLERKRLVKGEAEDDVG